MRVSIDRELCQGHAVCASLVPEVFAIPEDGAGAEVLVSEVDSSLEPGVRRAVLGCPERAIKVEG